MTHRTRNTLILASALIAATPPFVLWFVLMAKFPADASTDHGFAIALCFLLGAFLAPAVGFVCGFLTANFVYYHTACFLK